MRNNIPIIVAFVALLIATSATLAQYYTINKAIEQGLQQCRVTTGTTSEILWRKDCPETVI